MGGPQAAQGWGLTVSGGMFCIENYSADLSNRDTVRALLDYLEHLEHDVIHRRIDTPGELRHYLRRWSEMPKYRVGYVAAHGELPSCLAARTRMSTGWRLARLTSSSSAHLQTRDRAAASPRSLERCAIATNPSSIGSGSCPRRHGESERSA